MGKKKLRKKITKQEKSMNGLLAAIERIDKKLDLFSIGSKTLPVVVLVTAALLGSVLYLSQVATRTQSTSELPATGEEEQLVVTQNFKILSPENNEVITLPYEVIGLSIPGFIDGNITLYAKDADGSTQEVGIMFEGTEDGEYRISWEEATKGDYSLWVEFVDPSSTVKVKSDSVTITLE